MEKRVTTCHVSQVVESEITSAPAGGSAGPVRPAALVVVNISFRQRQVWRAFIANRGKPLRIPFLAKWAYPRQREPLTRSQLVVLRRSIHRLAARFPLLIERDWRGLKITHLLPNEIERRLKEKKNSNKSNT